MGFENPIDARSSRERNLVVAMVVGRIIAAEASKLVMTWAWADTTLPDELRVADAGGGRTRRAATIGTY